MPIFEYGCTNCRTKVEKIVLRKVISETVPKEILERCKKCGAITRHARVVSKPAYVGLTPPGTSKKSTRMSQMRKTKDPAWKSRVKQGLNPDGKRLTNLKDVNRAEWKEQMDTAFPDLEEKQKEVVSRAEAGEYTSVVSAVLGK